MKQLWERALENRQREKEEQRRAGNRGGMKNLSPERIRQIARKGGRAAHAKGTAHKWTSAEAAAAGRKGGAESWRRRRQAAGR